MIRQDGLAAHGGNGMIESAYITDKRERMEEEPEEEIKRMVDKGLWTEAMVKITEDYQKYLQDEYLEPCEKCGMFHCIDHEEMEVEE